MFATVPTPPEAVTGPFKCVTPLFTKVATVPAAIMVTVEPPASVSATAVHMPVLLDQLTVVDVMDRVDDVIEIVEPADSDAVEDTRDRVDVLTNETVSPSNTFFAAGRTFQFELASVQIRIPSHGPAIVYVVRLPPSEFSASEPDVEMTIGFATLQSPVASWIQKNRP